MVFWIIGGLGFVVPGFPSLDTLHAAPAGLSPSAAGQGISAAGQGISAAKPQVPAGDANDAAVAQESGVEAIDEDRASFKFDLDQLRGSSEREGAFAADALVQASKLAGDVGDAHRKFIRRSLSASRVDAVAKGSPEAPELLGTRRVVESLALITASSGAPFESSSELLLDLLGRGPRPLRESVVGAIVKLIDWQARTAAAEAKSLKASVVERLVHNPPPEAGVMSDASRVLWLADGKTFIAAAIEGMELNKTKFPTSTPMYIDEVRSRLGIDFDSADAWSAWWTEYKQLSLSEIFVACHKQISAESAKSWRAVIRRLRETGDAARVLEGLQEALGEARNTEVRLAALTALGEFSSWVLGVKLVGDDEAAVAAQRENLVERAFVTLVDVLDGKYRPRERSAIRRGALVALQSYQGFLSRRAATGDEQDQALVFRVSELVGESFEASMEGGRHRLSAEGRTDLLVSMRTLGALRLKRGSDKVKIALISALEAEDVELLRVGVVSLGRLRETPLTFETTKLLFDIFHLKPARPAPKVVEQLGDLRRSCVSALNARSSDSNVRGAQRTFFHRLLEKDETKDYRIPAILGLGTLAQDSDAIALQSLVDVAVNRARFEDAEVIAALNAIGYIGDEKALQPLLSLLGQRSVLDEKDDPVSAHLWRKLITLIKPRASTLLPQAARILENAARSQDAPIYLEALLELCRETEIAALLTTESINFGDRDRVHLIWTMGRSLAAAAELSSSSSPIETDRLTNLQNQNPQIGKDIGPQVAALGEQVARNKLRAEVAKRMENAKNVAPDALVADFLALLDPELSASERWLTFRWVERMLGAKSLVDAGKANDVRSLWDQLISDPTRADLFKGLPETFGARHLERVSKKPSETSSAVEKPATTGGDEPTEPQPAKMP